jgi:predicted glycoside hydrolase/deacetylase ChbG (UPF0249 family)
VNTAAGAALGLDGDPAGERRLLIVNADDFGRTPSVNEGIVRAHRDGIVTSASLMVRWPAAGPAAAASRSLPGLSVGLHLDFGEWLSRDGRWALVYEVVPLEPEPVAAEARRQLTEFRRLLDRNPTHLDSHQHVHNDPKVSGVLAALAAELGIPLREHDPGIRFEGGFFGQENDGAPVPGAITVAGLAAILDGLLPGVTELCCHPGAGRDSWSVYDRERAQEVATLCDADLRRSLDERRIELRSFARLPEHGIPAAP